ncbi:hypothetical protein HMPREF9601_02328 [Cutibacterium acnes HL030PA1]|nr:hypothetical protein HMPREF9574_01521 [Cutibacterium acnes HL074PA1]EFT06838.1 hypothetical protein HMPREF9618_02063 [Cutibacterium acnes HL082PA1]EFT77564.1 hypothetical protein HMPREF9601_02328 [Cutibacterium acnes HL030PA1]
MTRTDILTPRSSRRRCGETGKRHRESGGVECRSHEGCIVMPAEQHDNHRSGKG